MTSDTVKSELPILIKRLTDVLARVEKNRHTVRSIMALLGGNLTSSVLNTVGAVLVARFLGPEVTGPFRAYTIPLTYLTFLHLGTNDGLWRQIPYYVGKEMPEKVSLLASTAGYFTLFIAVVGSCGFACCALYSLAIGNYYGLFGWLSQAFLCWEIFYVGYLKSTYRTLNHFVRMARIQVFQTVVTFGMLFFLPFLKFYGLCARSAIPSFLAVWRYHRNRPLKVAYRFDIKAFGELIKIGLPYSIWGTLYTSAWFATESALVLYLEGSTALGLFSAAYAVRGAMNSLPVAVWQVLTPRVVTTLARDGSVSKANSRIIGVTVGLTGLMIVIAFAGSFVLDALVPYIIPKYIAAIPVMNVCLWFPAIQAAFLPINTLFATGRPWLYGRSVIAGLIVFPLATYILYPEIGGILSVTVGSLLGRVARTIAAYVDLIVLTRREA